MGRQWPMEADGSVASLQQALDVVQQTAQAHVDALTAFEAAFTCATRYLDDQRHSFEIEREALARERVELEDDRASFLMDRDAHMDREALDGHRDMDLAKAWEKARPDGSPKATAGIPRTPREVEHQMQERADYDLDHDASNGDEDDVPSRRRARSRSRGNNFPVRGPSSSMTQKVQTHINRLRLDEDAARQVQQFPPDQALRMLEQVGEGVRNPSAFVTKMCNRNAHGDLSSDYDGVDRRVDDTIDRLGLDESARRAVQQLPAEEAFRILDQIGDEVRNPSAFIMALTHRKGSGKTGGERDREREQRPKKEEQVAAGIARLKLDATARRMVLDMAPEQALPILDMVGSDVRNPSALVTAEIRKVKTGYQGGSKTGQGRQDPRDFERQLDRLARDLDLDLDCVDSLRTISMQESIQILELLASDLPSIRNRSAFVFAEVRKRQARTPPPPPPKERR